MISPPKWVRPFNGDVVQGEDLFELGDVRKRDWSTSIIFAFNIGLSAPVEGEWEEKD